ncbi:prepilin peptidase-dependent protein [Serratia ureilytica]|uniref:prepilin peptidase-dependent protein n=1 Tax=Serratia ureilytica TaxID=300181 RepID=UPI0018D72D21|nr:prepilin peptidase-dependent protein [Serratia ureilytica]MBH2895599.1 prepilin peptidase-dependent protein [Serratia ureilytica]
MKENTLSNIDDRQRGITLIELLAALLIAGMLTGWGVGQWRHHQQTLRLEHTAQQLLAFLLRLQADANWRNRTTLLWFKNGPPGCLGGGVPPPDCAAAEGSVFSPSYRDVVLSGYTDKEIGFYGLRNTAQAGHILLSNEVGGLRLVLSTRGRLRLCSEGLRIRGIAPC